MVRTVRMMSLLVPISLVLLLVPVLAASAQAAPVRPNAGAPEQWAYGAQRWVNVSVGLPNGSYAVHAFFGWDVILTATNTSASMVALQAVRTMGFYYYAQLCSPNCTTPTGLGNVSMSGWETDAGFVNLTNNATVYENGAATAALGIVDSSAQSRGHLNESFRFQRTHANVTRSLSASLTVTGSARATVAFSPSLGLVPWNAQPNSNWNSSAPFTAQGSWAMAWAAQRTNQLGVAVNASGNPSGAINGFGELSVAGQDLGNVTLSNGESVPAIMLSLSGPFDEVDGVILVPHQFDLFGRVHHVYDASTVAAQTATTSRVDFAIDAIHHRVHVSASTTVFAAADQSLTSAAPTSGPAPSATSSLSPSEVQGQPETVPLAQHASGCLTGTCPSAGTVARAGLGGSLLPLLLIGLVAATIVGTVGVVEYRVWSRLRTARGLRESAAQGPVHTVPPAGATAELGPAVPPPAPGTSGTGEPPRLM